MNKRSPDNSEPLYPFNSEPENPQEVDHSRRPSPHSSEPQFDSSGHPDNPWVSPDQSVTIAEGRGELEKCDVYNEVIIAEPKKYDELYILLVQDNDKKWSLPTNRVSDDSQSFSLEGTEPLTVYEGYNNDPSNTHDAGIKTEASLAIIDFKPEGSNPEQTSGQTWVKLESLQELLDTADNLQANQAEILKAAFQAGFDIKIQNGQILFNQGKFKTAEKDYKNALRLAQNDEQKARAVRGLAACGGKAHEYKSPSEALELAKQAYNIYSNLAKANNSAEVRREVAQSALVLGTLALDQAVEGEAYNYSSKQLLFSTEALHYLNEARRILEDVEAQEGKLDQYTINLMGRLSIASSLFGNQKEGLKQAWRAIRIAPMSESPRLPTSANMSTADRYRAKGRATLRGFGALGVNLAVKTNNRKRVLNIAARLVNPS